MAPVDDQAPAPLDDVEELFDHLYRQAQSLALVGEPSLSVRLTDVASKSLLIAAASRFEREITVLIAELASEYASPAIAEFCMNQGVSRKYHTMFDWDANNANRFYRLFGENFQERAKARAVVEEEFGTAAKAFLRIGSLRNGLVHADFVSHSLDSTLGELIDDYRLAKRFIAVLSELLADEMHT